MNQPISLIFSLRMISCSFLNILWFKLGSNKTKQTKSFALSLFICTMPRYINSEKKSSEKKSSEKNRSDLPTLFQIKNKRNKKNKKENRPTYPV